MTAEDPQHIGALNPWVATAPEPTLVITDHTAVISDVRFVWRGIYCGWCRNSVALWTDGGTIAAGIKLGRPRRRSPAAAHWYQTYRPSGVPSIPDGCPHPGCPHPATRTPSTGEQARTGRRSTTAASTPTVNTGASAHHHAALPSLAKGTREGRCPSKPPHSDDEQQEGQPIRVALEHILTVNDASRPLRPQPERGGTPVARR